MKIGIIGLGAMGLLYAKKFAEAGYEILASDRPENQNTLEQKVAGSNIRITEGNEVARKSDFLIYAIPMESLDVVVQEYGPATKDGAIVGGASSVKGIEVRTFEKYLPKETPIIPFHSLHGPSLDTAGQTLALIKHRTENQAYATAKEILAKLGSNIIEIPNIETHDILTAETQATTHMAFLSMGSAWMSRKIFPWENQTYYGGIDNVKSDMTLRILSGNAHTYAGLALLNPHAKEKIRQYAQSTQEIFTLAIRGKRKDLIDRIDNAKKKIFSERELMCEDSKMGELSFRDPHAKRNSHLSLLAMTDTWYTLGISPYENSLCTPPFKLRLGIANYLFKDEKMLESSIQTAIKDKTILEDDLAFVLATNQWATIVEQGNYEEYKRKFVELKEFFKEKIPSALVRSDSLIRHVSAFK